MNKKEPFIVLWWDFERLFFNYNITEVKRMYNYYNNQQLIRVTGLDGAKAYQMTPNSAVALFDGNEDIFYIKTTDGAGFPTIRAFKFEPIETNTSSVEYVSRSEFEALRKEIREYGKHNIPRDGDADESDEQN